MTDSKDERELLSTWSHFFESEEVGSYIGGRIYGGSGDSFTLVNPADGDRFLSYRDAGAELAADAIARALVAQRAWYAETAAARGRCLTEIARAIWEASEPLARLESLSAGNPPTSSSTTQRSTKRSRERYSPGSPRQDKAVWPDRAFSSKSASTSASSMS